jgi:hypothetical protein
MGVLVEAAREVKTHVQILVENVVDWSFIGGREDLAENTKLYNTQLERTLPNWSRYESLVSEVDVILR